MIESDEAMRLAQASDWRIRLAESRSETCEEFETWLVADSIKAGRLKRLRLAQSEGGMVAMYVVRQHGQRLGPASQWLIEDLRERLKQAISP